MPIATVDPEDTERFDLKTLPEGYVVLRRMSYGAWLKRQEMAMNMQIHGMDKKDSTTELKSMQRSVTQYEFSQSVVEHNLTDRDERPLDFRQPHTLDLLAPKIGNEISKYVSDLHEFEDDLGN